tara:strand:- start:3 stop:1319 length:1317 start_codon:yes stop_codon:yes gene_type:complete
MATTNTTQHTYTRQDLNSKTVEELHNICRQDRDKYRGFSKFTKRPLIEFILRTNNSISNAGGTAGSTSNGVRRIGRRSGRNFSRSIPVSQEDTDDYSLELSTMFGTTTYENDYDNFEIDEEDAIFNSYPSKEQIITTVKVIENVIKSNDSESIVTWEPYKDEDKTEIYDLSKKQIYRKYGKLGQEEILLHGTDESNIREILENDFSLTINVKHGTVFGKGVYFTNEVRKALEYSERGKKDKYILMVKVYIGDYVQGSIQMDIHPKIPGTDKRYDTSVDNVYNPIQFIKKNNSQFNIVGIVKISLSNPDISGFGLNTLNCNLKIHNNSNRTMMTYFSFGPFKDGVINSNHKYLGFIKSGASASYKTAIGHHFALIIKNFGIVRLLKIEKNRTEITIEDKYLLSDKTSKYSPPKWKCSDCKNKIPDDCTTCNICGKKRYK